MPHEDHEGLCHIAPFGNDGIPAFFIGYTADGESQLFQNPCTEISHGHAAFFAADAGVDGHHVLPETDHVIPMCIDPLIRFFSCVHSICMPPYYSFMSRAAESFALSVRELSSAHSLTV